MTDVNVLGQELLLSPESDSDAERATNRQDSENRRSCWVCFATDDDDWSATWRRPCQCKGSTMWVHDNCLQLWIDEKQKGDPFVQVACPQCGFQYGVIFPKMNAIVALLERVDRLIVKSCPIITGGIILGSVYWTAVTYGAVTLMEVMGQKEAMRAMAEADPLLLLAGLPTVPILLVVARSVQWEKAVVMFLQKYVLHLPRRAQPLPIDPRPNEAMANAGQNQEQQGNANVPAQQPAMFEVYSTTRLLCGALALPTIAMLCGRWFFSDCTNSSVKRTLLGGVSFLAVKGVCKVYLMHATTVRKRLRRIMDFEG